MLTAMDFFSPWKPYLLFIGIVFISVHIALVQVNEAIDRQDEGALMAGLNRPALSLLEVLPQNSSWYLLQLCDSKEQKMQVIEWNRYYVSVCTFLAGFNPERNYLYSAFQHHLWKVLWRFENNWCTNQHQRATFALKNIISLYLLRHKKKI